MNQQSQNNNPDSSGDFPLKRKRGRPRKYPRPDAEESANITVSHKKNQNPAGGENAQLPPGFEGINGNQRLQRDLENDLNDVMVGQVVSGVIEAVFDAGYLLSVRVGNSDTTLRGLVFKPGRYVPISPENDVAPGVPMIRRNEVPFPSTQVHTPLPKGRNEQHINIRRNENRTMNGSPSVTQAPSGAVSSSNFVASSGKNVPSVAEQPTGQLPRGNAVPVLFQPANLSNGVLASNQPSQVMTHAALGSGTIVTKEIPVDGNKDPSSQTQTSQNMLSRGMQSVDVPHHQSSANTPSGGEAKSTRQPSIPFENLVTEVIKRIQAPSESMDTETDNSKSGDKILLKDSNSRKEDKVNDMDQPILIKPLQAVLSDPQDHSASASKPSENTKTGKMTELLQDNKMENQASKAEELGSVHKVDNIRNLGTEVEDAETGQSVKHAEAWNA